MRRWSKKMAVFGEKKVRRVQNVDKVKKDFMIIEIIKGISVPFWGRH